MYAPHFGLRQEAFSIAPDPRFLFLSAMHREALAHLLYGLQGGGGFVLLTGEIGAGKTTVCRCFLEQIPAGQHVAYVFNPKLTVVELLQTICQEFGIALPDRQAGSVKQMVDALNGFMLQAHAAGQACLLVIDEAQSLSPELLEQLRLLTNLETSERKLLQIILIGQPELRTMLARPDLEQLAQRVIARVHLGALNAAETAEYVRHRLAVAGLGGALPFDAAALALIHRISGGVPRRINLLCQRALLGAYSLGATRIGRGIVRQAAREVFDGDGLATRRNAVAGTVGATALVAVVVVAAGVAWWTWSARQPGGRRAPTIAAATADGPASAASAAVATAAALQAASAASVASTSHASAPMASAASAATGPAEQLDAARFDDAAAWHALGLAWHLDVPATAPCEALRAEAIACHRAQGNLALLRKLDRPALLTMQPQGLLLLLALGERQATLVGPSGRQTVAVATLEQGWTGHYATLWRLPPGWPAGGGDRALGAAADWVLERLVAIQGPARGALRGARDEQLRQRVFAFQVGEGLALDGVAGPVTLMQLNRASGVDEPRLRKDL